MEGIIFGIFALSIVLLIGGLQCIVLMKHTSSEFYKELQKKRMIVLNTSAVFLLITGVVLCSFYY